MFHTNEDPNPTMPTDMVEVTKEQFFQLLFADKRDIMPNTDHCYFTNWCTTSREVWGWNSSGWRTPFTSPPPRYAVNRTTAKTLSATAGK